MNTKTLNIVAAIASVAGAALTLQAVTPQVTSVTMTQSSSSRLVNIDYTFTGSDAVITLDVQTNANTSAAAGDPGWTSIGGVAVCNATGDVWKKVTSDGTTHHIEWRPDLSWPDHIIANGGARAVVTAWSLDNTPDYMVVDLTVTGGADTQRYYPSVDFLPGSQPGQTGAITNNPIYKTTTIVMRKIMAKGVTWTMGSTSLETDRDATREVPHQVTLTNNYYIGVFEVTQAQWALIDGNYPSFSRYDNAEYRAMRPVDGVSSTSGKNLDVRTNNDNSHQWPAPPHDDSFLGKLRLRTGIDFDIPGEAQWEFAARAGNGDTKWGDGSGITNEYNDSNLKRLGRYRHNGGLVNGNTPDQNVGLTNGTAIVGSYAPNNWGIYDMYGNVAEWCLDWLEDDITAHDGKVNVDPSAPMKTLSGNDAQRRVIRGGSTASHAGSCRPACRENPDSLTFSRGLRVVCTAGLQ